MTAIAPTEYRERKEKAAGNFEVHIISYHLGERYHCTVDNVNPGAVIARAQGFTREAAEQTAIAKARELLSKP